MGSPGVKNFLVLLLEILVKSSFVFQVEVIYMVSFPVVILAKNFFALPVLVISVISFPVGIQSI